MTTPVVAVIPTIGLSPLLDGLVYKLIEEGIPTRLYVNGPVRESILKIVEGWPHDGLVELHVMPDVSIYAEWNHGVHWACEVDSYALVMNDDIQIPDQLATSLADALDGHQEYGVMGVDSGSILNSPPYGVRPLSHQQGNRYAFSAWCFMARPEAWQDIDERYKIWYGDDDLVWKTNSAGWFVGALQGTGVHHSVSTTTGQTPWVAHAAYEDGQLWVRTGH